MPLQRYSLIKQHTSRLDKAMEAVKQELERLPAESLYPEYAHSKEEFLRDFRAVNPDALDHAIAELNSAVKLLTKLKKVDKTVRLHKP